MDLFEVPDNVEMLDLALQNHDVNINVQDEYGHTILIKSIDTYRSFAFTMRLLNAGADPNISNHYGETPLYWAMTHSTMKIAEELLKRGANVNAITKTGFTILHNAIEYNNLDAISLLLYYKADVNIYSKEITTPFVYAVEFEFIKEAEMMLHYYDGGLDDILTLTSNVGLATKLIEKGANVNYFHPNENFLESIFGYGNAMLFKLAWERFDCRILLNVTKEEPFLLKYIIECNFSTEDWLECLFLLLNSPVAFELVLACYEVPELLSELLIGLFHRRVSLSDSLSIINIFLSLNATVSMKDVYRAYQFFGFNEEFDTLIYFVDYNYNEKDNEKERPRMFSLILGIEDDFGCEQPDPMSLLELSRASSRRFIKQFFGVTKPYQFYDAVKEMNLPEPIKEFVLFKSLIYRCED